MSFFRHEVFDVMETARHCDALTRLWRGELDGVLVKGVYSAAECAAVRNILEAGAHDLPRTEFPPSFNSSFFGVNLNLADPSLAGYFEAADRFRAGLARIFPGDLDLERRAAGVMSALDGGLPYEAPPGPQPGQRHMFTTLRWHRTGGFIPLHIDDEQATRPSYRYVLPLIAGKLVSFVIAFAQADAGGETEFFNVGPVAENMPIVVEGRSAIRTVPAGAESFRYSLVPGEMLICRSGGFLHRLTPVIGPRARWNACSFMSVSRDGARVYSWG